jgi:hypothetical protein
MLISICRTVDEASNEASAVLNNIGLYTIETDLDKEFLKEITSTICD